MFDPQLGPVNNFDLDQLIILICFFLLVLLFLLLKCAEIPFYSVFLNINQNLTKKGPPKNDNFSHFAKHRFIKKHRFVANPHLTKKWDKSKEERKGDKETKARNQKKAKKKDRKEERKEEERDRERAIEKGGGQKKLRRNKGRHSKINKKCPFLWGKTGLFPIRSKEGEKEKKKKTKQQTNEEGLVPSEVALWATSPDP